jgi:hypothetical protein
LSQIKSVTKTFIVDTKLGLIRGTEYVPKVFSSNSLCPIVSYHLVEKIGKNFTNYSGNVAIINTEGDMAVSLIKPNKYDIFIEFITRGGFLFKLPLEIEVKEV